MRTYYVFQSATPELRGFAEEASGITLPAEHGPWTLTQQIGPDDKWTPQISRAVVATGLLENGFYLWGPREQRSSSKPMIESDRVEGTAVFDGHGNQIGTIKRLVIEKVSGRVIDVDVTFGGFLGLGVQHRTIPWDKLTYDREFGGYQTDVSEAQIQAAPAFHVEEKGRSGPEQPRREYWDVH
jgi:hypothetical protein